MRTGTIGGYRAAEYEKIAAVESNGYQGRKLYAVDGLPGIFRRVAEPKGITHEEAGCVQVFFDGSLLSLTPDPEILKEMTEGGFAHLLVNYTDDAFALVEKLQAKREDYLKPEQSTTEALVEPKTEGETDAPTF